MTLLAFDTATRATVVGVAAPDGTLLAAGRHDPAPGERPGHAPQLLALCAAALEEAGVAWQDLRRVAAGVGPGTFTGLRIGVATARALAQGLACEVAAVGTLAALAEGARARVGGPSVLAVLDARRGEAFAAGFDPHGAALGKPLAVGPEELTGLLDPAHGPWLAVGDGAVAFRAALEGAAEVPLDGSPLHRVQAGALCRLAASAPPADRDALVPAYVRTPDAVPRR